MISNLVPFSYLYIIVYIKRGISGNFNGQVLTFTSGLHLMAVRKNMATECLKLICQFDPVTDMHAKTLMWIENKITALDRYNSLSDFKLTTSHWPQVKNVCFPLQWNVLRGSLYRGVGNPEKSNWCWERVTAT